MAQPRIRDFVTFLTTLPASTMIAACLFLPHTKDCSSGRHETPFEAGTWVVILPLVVLGVLPIAWRVSERVRQRSPEIVLAFTMIALSLFVITLPVAIYLVWNYSKQTLRGEPLVALCSAICCFVWLWFYPLITLFDRWLPAAEMTWIFGAVMFVGMLFWTSAAAARARNVDEKRPLHVTNITEFAAFAALATRVSRSCGDGTTRVA